MARTLLTAEDLWRLPSDGHDDEPVKGELVEVVPPGRGQGSRPFCKKDRSWVRIRWLRPAGLVLLYGLVSIGLVRLRKIDGYGQLWRVIKQRHPAA